MSYTVLTPKSEVQCSYNKEANAIAAARLLSKYLNGLPLDILKDGKPYASVWSSIAKDTFGMVFITYKG